MAKKRRDKTSLSSLLGKKREIDIDEIEKATQKVHESKKVQSSTPSIPEKKEETPPKVEADKRIRKKSPPKTSVKKPSPKQKERKPSTDSEQVVRASIATPYELYLRAKRQQRKDGYRSLGAFYLHCVEAYLKKPVGKSANYEEPDFSDSIDVSVSPELELWTQIKLNQRKLGFKNMAGFYVFCLNRYLGT